MPAPISRQVYTLRKFRQVLPRLQASEPVPPVLLGSLR